ncbi:pancreatic triacylglycerol lipase-like isoform X2 [Colletes latitarsis]|uniref:pancreatic triacylglycerol lipase-like isoform X2 n=1 Tax=Colletes latitarsis TaxID=2605962 RepID=UPI00403578C3
MKAYILTSLLLVCSVSGLPRSFGPLAVFDDNDNLVPLNLNSSNMNLSESANYNLNQSVFFYLYTTKTKENPELLYLNDVDGLKKSNFSIMKATKMITHGWTNSYKNPHIVKIRDAFLQNGDYNVIMIDWSKISKTRYSYASHQVITVGKYVSSMIDFLQKQGMDVSRLTIAGHSLGGHVAGLAGHYANSTVNYIVGLDPALPNFAFAKPGSRISASDAQYVTIIHTNGGFLGFETEIGDSDFYPNGGTVQTGCAPDMLGACSHYRSCLYFAEAINSQKGFWGTLCNNFFSYIEDFCTSDPEEPMGTVDPTLNATGMYYLQTAPTSPYALGR